VVEGERCVPTSSHSSLNRWRVGSTTADSNFALAA
jgi:hypothetical protein